MVSWTLNCYNYLLGQKIMPGDFWQKHVGKTTIVSTVDVGAMRSIELSVAGIVVNGMDTVPSENSFFIAIIALRGLHVKLNQIRNRCR